MLFRIFPKSIAICNIKVLAEFKGFFGVFGAILAFKGLFGHEKGPEKKGFYSFNTDNMKGYLDSKNRQKTDSGKFLPDVVSILDFSRGHIEAVLKQAESMEKMPSEKKAQIRAVGNPHPDC